MKIDKYAMHNFAKNFCNIKVTENELINDVFLNIAQD